MAFRFNRTFELSALQEQRLQFPEWSMCQTDTSAMRWWRVILASLASSVVHCMIIDFDISAFGFRAAHGGHAILFVLTVFIEGMTVWSESRVLDVAALMNPTLHTSASGFQARRLRATREVSKARGSPGR